MAFASGYFKTSYRADLSLVETRTRWLFLSILVIGLICFPFIASPFLLDLASQVYLSLIGAVALMLLTGYAGQISLGHAGFIAAGAYVTAILFKELNAPILGDPACLRTCWSHPGHHLRTSLIEIEGRLSGLEHPGHALHRYLHGRRIRVEKGFRNGYCHQASIHRVFHHKRSARLVLSAPLCCR